MLYFNHVCKSYKGSIFLLGGVFAKESGVDFGQKNGDSFGQVT